MQQQKTLYLARLALFISLTAVIQMTGLPQPVTGPLVNAMLFITAQLLSPGAAAVLGLLTPMTALIRGQLPPALAPMLPLIAMSNVLLIAVFRFTGFTVKSPPSVFSLRWFAAVTASSAAKFIFLYAGITLLLPLILGGPLPRPLAAIMMFPQLFTALAGGIISGFAVMLLKKKLDFF